MILTGDPVGFEFPESGSLEQGDPHLPARQGSDTFPGSTLRGTFPAAVAPRRPAFASMF
jgi:hypothetical protein